MCFITSLLFCIRYRLYIRTPLVSERVVKESSQPCDVSAPAPATKQRTALNVKEYFVMVAKINKHRQMAAYVKQFTAKIKTFEEMLKALEDLFLPNHQEAFIGALCLFQNEEQRRLFTQRALALQLKI
ncbi:hypothetical protein Q1695_000279 [Nippostrongylus brasiliensis]|nr:hypothetical protein Q1695_000279 [Nippostrongylus brasiliensis]